MTELRPGLKLKIKPQFHTDKFKDLICEIAEVTDSNVTVKTDRGTQSTLTRAMFSSLYDVIEDPVAVTATVVKQDLSQSSAVLSMINSIIEDLTAYNARKDVNASIRASQNLLVLKELFEKRAADEALGQLLQ